MANLITGVTSGTGGLSTTADASGQIALQTNNGTTALTLDNSQNATFTGNISTPTGTITASSFSGNGSALTGITTGFSNIVYFTSSQSWTIPTGITKIKVTVIGGGAGGSAAGAGAGGSGATSSFGSLLSCTGGAANGSCGTAKIGRAHV